MLPQDITKGADLTLLFVDQLNEETMALRYNYKIAEKMTTILIKRPVLLLCHTASSDTIFVQIYMDPPPEVPGVSKDAPGSTKHAI